MALESSEPLLACGTPLQRRIDDVAEERGPQDPEHVAGCAYCEAALETIAAAQAQLIGFAREPIEVPRELSERIMSQLRGLRGSFDGELVLASDRGRTEIRGRALGVLARVAALSVAGVVLATVVSVEIDPEHDDTVRIGLRLAIELGPSVEVLAALVRAEVDRQLLGAAGASAVVVDIEIADVLA